MFIEIEPNSVVPIYTQLINQIKKAIVMGEMGAGDSLPSVRVLSGDLGVNMHTVNKAYNLLVEEGILAKSQKGYIIDISTKVSGDFEEQMQTRIEELLVDAFIHQLPPEQVKKWTESIAQKLKKEW